MQFHTDGILLDVDGTLWNSTPVTAPAWTRAVREGGCPDRTVLPEHLQALFGRKMDVIADLLLPELEPESRYEVMKYCCAYEQQALEETDRELCYPGVRETIRELAGDVPLFIVSNCQAGYIELFLRKTELTPYVRDIECFGNNGKGKAENIRLLSDRNHLCAPLYVGDTQGDADAAAEAGIPFIYADYGFGKAARYDAKISEFSELKDLIRKD